MSQPLHVEAARKEPIWSATKRMPSCPPLKADTHADVCIVGAGIAGLSIGYLLAQAGKAVVILDDGPLAGGMTSATTAHLANALDRRYVEIERLHGEEGARLAAASHTAAIDRIEAIASDEQIDCDFERVDGHLFLGPDDSEDVLERELAAAHRAGLDGVRRLDSAPPHSFDMGPCLRFPRQGQFHPLKYLAGLVRAIHRREGRLYAKTHVDAITGGAPARITAGKRTITADAVVVATNNPVNDLVAMHTKQAAYMTYAIGARVPRAALKHALYWDTENPFHYVRLQSVQPARGKNGRAGHDVLIVGGEDHRTGQAHDTEERHVRLEAWARERFPMMEDVEYTWAGQVMETIDGLAFIGRNPMDKDNVYIVTGDCGMGMTHGTIAGMLISDLILGRDNPWAKLYDPSRKRLAAGGTFVKEALNTAAQYTDWVTSGDVRSVDEIARECGAILRRGLTKAAVYRDENDKLHHLSAVCPHLGCIVQWNSAEKTWDCPCHGSRFDKLGKVVNGPANSDLRPLEGQF